MDIGNYSLKYVTPANIEFDKENPRGENFKQIISSEEFTRLVQSVIKFGIIEPLIVKKGKGKDRYILIDGERRLRASLKANIKSVPIHIIHEDTDAMILAYQIHMLRENWNKSAETKSIKKIIESLRNDNLNITDREIKKKLIDITSHKDHEIDDLMKLIKYDDEVISNVIDERLSMSYLVQIESNFITPIKRMCPEILTIKPENEIRNIMANKALNGLLVSTRYLMDTFKKVFKGNYDKTLIIQFIIEFLITEEQSIDKVFNKIVNTHTQNPESLNEKVVQDKVSKISIPKKILVKKKNDLEQESTSQKSPIFITPIKLKKYDQLLINDIKPKYEKIAASLTVEEMEYVNEAIYCLNNHCFKAAALMIWSAGISKILKLINTNLQIFVDSSIDMNTNPKSVYKHFAKNFQKNISSIEDVFRFNQMGIFAG